MKITLLVLSFIYCGQIFAQDSLRDAYDDLENQDKIAEIIARSFNGEVETRFPTLYNIHFDPNYRISSLRTLTEVFANRYDDVEIAQDWKEDEEKPEIYSAYLRFENLLMLLTYSENIPGTVSLGLIRVSSGNDDNSEN